MSTMGWRDIGTRESLAESSAMTEALPDPATSLALSPPRQPTRKRLLVQAEDPAEDLVAHIKKCRVSSTPGELRLKKDLAEGDLLCRQGVARFDKTAGSPLECQLTFLCPIGGVGGGQGQQAATASAAHRRVPTTFSIVVPKFYPHDPPLLYAERCFSMTCPFIRDDGLLQLPFLSPGIWSSISTMSFVAKTLLEGLQNFADGHPQPWEPPPVELRAGGRRDPPPQGINTAVAPNYAGDRGEKSREADGRRDVGAVVAADGAVFVCDGTLLDEGCRGVVQPAGGSTANGGSGSRHGSSSAGSGKCEAVAGRRPQQQQQPRHGDDSSGGGECHDGMDVTDSL